MSFNEEIAKASLLLEVNLDQAAIQRQANAAAATINRQLQNTLTAIKAPQLDKSLQSANKQALALSSSTRQIATRIQQATTNTKAFQTITAAVPKQFQNIQTAAEKAQGSTTRLTSGFALLSGTLSSLRTLPGFFTATASGASAAASSVSNLAVNFLALRQGFVDIAARAQSGSVLFNQVAAAAGETGSSFDHLLFQVSALAPRLGALLARLGPVGVAIAAVAAATIAAAIAIPKLSTAIVRQAQSASNLNESLNAVSVTLGGAADQFLRTFEASESLGLSQHRLNAAITPIAAILRNTGFQGDALNQNLELITRRAIDVASVFNIEVEQALERFGAAIRGETRSVEALGIAFNEANVNNKALALGFQRTNGEFSESAKQQARLALIIEQSNKFAGDFANTSGELANLQRVLTAETEELRTEISQQFLPAAQQITSALIELVRDVGPDVTSFFQTIKPLINGVATGFSLLADGVDLVTSGLRFVDDALKNAFPPLRFLDEGLKRLGLTSKSSAKDIGNAFVRPVQTIKDTTTSTGELNDAFERIFPAIDALAPAARAYEQALKGVRDAQQSVNDALREAEKDATAAAKAVVEAEEDLADARHTLSQLLAEGGEEELTQARERLADTTDQLAEAELKRVDAQERLAALLAPATQDELAEATDGLTRAEIALQKAIRARDEALQALNATQEEALDLSGLSLDQLRSTLANARATAAAQRRAGRSTESEIDLKENAVLAEISVRDAVRDLEEARTDLMELERKGKTETKAIRDARNDLARADQDVARATRDAGRDRLALQAIELGNSQFSRDLKAARNGVADAEERLGNAQIRVAETAEESARRVSAARDGVRDAEDRVSEALRRQRDAQQEVNEKIAIATGDQRTILALKLQQIAANETLIRQSPGLLQSAIASVISSLPALPQSGGPGAPGAIQRQNLIRGINDLLRDPQLPFAAAFRRLGLPGFKEGGVVEGVNSQFGKMIRVGEGNRSEMVLPLQSGSEKVWSLLSKNLPRFPALAAGVQRAATDTGPRLSGSIRGSGGSAQDARQANKSLAKAIVQEMKEAGFGSGITIEAGAMPINIAGEAKIPEGLAARNLSRTVKKILEDMR